MKYRLDIIKNRSLGIAKPELWKASGLSKSQFDDRVLPTCIKLGAIECKDRKYYLSPLYVIEPLKHRQQKIIEETSLEHIYLGDDFLFYPPKNILLDDFGRVDSIQINKIFTSFFISMEKMLKNIRNKKAKMIWLNEINNAEQVNPLVKLDMWAWLLVGYLRALSATIFLALTSKMVKIGQETIPREEAVKIWIRKGEELKKEIFDDVLSKIWKNEDLTEEQMTQINSRYEEDYMDGYLYCKEVWSKIARTLQRQNYTFVISPFIEGGFGYRKEGTDEDVEYLKSLPGFKYSFREEDKLMDALNYVHLMEVRNKMIENKEVEQDDITYQPISKITGEPLVIPADPPSYFERGSNCFEKFQSALQRKLLDFCKDLGYKDKEQVIKTMGEFLSMFPCPIIPSAHDILGKKKGPVIWKRSAE